MAIVVVDVDVNVDETIDVVEVVVDVSVEVDEVFVDVDVDADVVEMLVDFHKTWSIAFTTFNSVLLIISLHGKIDEFVPADQIILLLASNITRLQSDCIVKLNGKVPRLLEVPNDQCML